MAALNLVRRITLGAVLVVLAAVICGLFGWAMADALTPPDPERPDRVVTDTGTTVTFETWTECVEHARELADIQCVPRSEP